MRVARIRRRDYILRVLLEALDVPVPRVPEFDLLTFGEARLDEVLDPNFHFGLALIQSPANKARFLSVMR